MKNSNNTFSSPAAWGLGTDLTIHPSVVFHRLSIRVAEAEADEATREYSRLLP